ncbi:hypothetical protein DERF_007653 [Dermatophagoides farinae]|uniref:Uncharacterized protein n=1 Tax=Dermatophagoides farinae TaxID=6954 RepID=A0A922HZE9_DERFA|nr:hypothetical protein DERF_007653 [Dermatophagoides farinae]
MLLICPQVNYDHILSFIHSVSQILFLLQINVKNEHLIQCWYMLCGYITLSDFLALIKLLHNT